MVPQRKRSNLFWGHPLSWRGPLRTMMQLGFAEPEQRPETVWARITSHNKCFETEPRRFRSGRLYRDPKISKNGRPRRWHLYYSIPYIDLVLSRRGRERMGFVPGRHKSALTRNKAQSRADRPYVKDDANPNMRILQNKASYITFQDHK